MNLLRVDTVEETKAKIKSCFSSNPPAAETVGLMDAAGRVLAEDIRSAENIPPFRRSTVDGYAVRSSDVGAAGDMIPTFLRITGEVLMGCDASGLVTGSGCCIYVPTGGEIPEGADAVVMVEYCETFGDDMLSVSKPAAPGENIVQIGEDMRAGEILLRKGRVLRPQDVGVLAAAGISSAAVFAPWRISVFSTGDELVGPGETPGPGQIRDINSYTIASRSCCEGFRVVRTEALKDDREILLRALESAKADSDVVVISGGSSQGRKDMTAELVETAADCGVLTHGIAAKPGKPTITGFDRRSRTLFIGLPGHPAAALMVYEQVLIETWRELTEQGRGQTVSAVMASNVPSAPGRRTFQLVSIENGDGADRTVPRALPVIAKSGMISPMSIADGYCIMSENQEGIRAGDMVTVHLWR